MLLVAFLIVELSLLRVVCWRACVSCFVCRFVVCCFACVDFVVFCCLNVCVRYVWLFVLSLLFAMVSLI